MLVEQQIPIIFIPGVLSSQLYLPENGRKLWLSPLFLSRSASMAVSCPLETRNNDIDQQSLLPLQREGGTMKQNILLIEKLINAFPNRPVYYFSYDFRQACDVSAEIFAAFVRKHGFARFDVVCHSMGGLLLASYAAKYGLDKIRKIVSLGVPFEGTPHASQVLITGEIWTLIPETITEKLGFSKEVIRAYPSVADLLPSLEYQAVCPLLKGGANLSPEDTESYYAGILPQTFLQSRIQQRIRHEEAYDLLLRHRISYFGIGCGKSTIKTLALSESGNPDEIRDFSGDGLIPYFSATMGRRIEGLGPERFRCFDCRHPELTKHPAPLEWVAEKLA
ncbi:MAG TPA: alpha/beta fold hydrolase [Methanocorpusculum sp.]|nr:alpha/beta fold hydrolase [Methanocorpusculum sp.]